MRQLKLNPPLFKMKFKYKFIIFFVSLFYQTNFSQVYDSSDLYFEEAKKDIAEQNFSRAARLSLRGLKLSPNDLDLKTLLGKANMQLGRYDTARWVLKEVYDKRKKDPDVLAYLVTIEQTTKRYSDAICFVNELLEIAPYSRVWWKRKINIYNEMGNFQEAERALKRLYQIYPEDTEIKNDYNYIMLGDGVDAVKNKKYDVANNVYKTVIDNDPTNRQAYLGIVRNELLKGNPEEALKITNRALEELPQDRELIEKKIGILEKLGRHEDAIRYITSDVNVSKEKFPEIHDETLPFLMQESARYNENRDPYELNKKLSEINGNSEALDYVINTALGKGYYIDARYYLDKALKRSPNSKKYLVKEMELLKATTDNTENYEKAVLTLHEKFPNDADISYAYNKIMYERGKQYVLDRQFTLALPIFEELISSPDFAKEAEQQIFGIYLEQNGFDEALDQIDKLIGLDPNNPEYLVKKSTLYQKMDLFDDALEITRDLEQQYPLNDRYSKIFVEQSEDYATYLMREQRYDKVLPVIEDALSRQNNNKNLLRLATNASSALPDFEKGINYSLSALSFYPNNKEFKLKLSNLYAQNKEYDKAVEVLDSLNKIYKYDRKIKNSLAEVYWYRAKNSEELGFTDDALKDYSLSDSLNPSQDYSLQRMINLYISKKSKDEALEAINENLKKYPKSNFLKYKKGLVYELLKQYDSAYYYQKFREIDDQLEKIKWIEALEILKASTLKNQLTVTYSQSSSDAGGYDTSLASFGYTHKYDEQNTFGADMNYAARNTGVAIQAGLNYSRIFTPTLYADAGFLVGSKFFPKFSLYGNAYKGLKNGFEVQAGFRYNRVIDSVIQRDENNNIIPSNIDSKKDSIIPELDNFLNFYVGGSKTWDGIWLNSKLNLMQDDEFSYYNLMVQTKIDVNTRRDYVNFIISFGNAPFDEQLAVDQQIAFLDFNNVLVGGGYGYNISPKTKLLFNASWVNFVKALEPPDDNNNSGGNNEEKPRSQIYINQYNWSISIISRF